MSLPHVLGPKSERRKRPRNSKEFRIGKNQGNLVMTSDVGGCHLPESLYGSWGCQCYCELNTPKSKVQETRATAEAPDSKESRVGVRWQSSPCMAFGVLWTITLPRSGSSKVKLLKCLMFRSRMAGGCARLRWRSAEQRRRDPWPCSWTTHPSGPARPGNSLASRHLREHVLVREHILVWRPACGWYSILRPRRRIHRLCTAGGLLASSSSTALCGVARHPVACGRRTNRNEELTHYPYPAESRTLK